MILSAPAKLNLCLYLGGRRADGLHELCSIFEPLELADRVEIRTGAEADEVICGGVEGPNLAAAALTALRALGWAGPPVRVEIEKRIPVAGGLGGGSADAAAVLRLAEGMPKAGLEKVAASLGADVPSQLEPRPLLVGGAGERLEPIPAPGAHGIVLMPLAPGLSAAEVYAEADRLGALRSAAELAAIEEQLREATAGADSPLAYAELVVNDLQPAALSLRPSIAESLDALRGAGAAISMVGGSGPTAFGLFENAAGAERAAAGLTGAIATAPASESVA
ncbi:MAG: 4-(cytidine 5'-diphospho)-2-C-methyl-D-erythritol kinase [Solirubrobacterales bacterium]